MGWTESGNDRPMCRRKRRAVIILVMAAIAAVHLLRIGSHLEGDLYLLYYGYASDILLPFGFYLLLCAAEEQIHPLKNWWMKLATAFLLPAGAETLQAIGIPALGRTFDPLDYAAYACGAALGVAADRFIFPRIFRFWTGGG